MLQLFVMYVFQLRLTKQDNYTVPQHKATFLFYTNLYAMLRMRVMLQASVSETKMHWHPFIDG